VNVAVPLEIAAASVGHREALRCGDPRSGYEPFAAARAVRGARAHHAALLDATRPVVSIAPIGDTRAGLPFAPPSRRRAGHALLCTGTGELLRRRARAGLPGGQRG
jgi:hypothetical protein